MPHIDSLPDTDQPVRLATLAGTLLLAYLVSNRILQEALGMGYGDFSDSNVVEQYALLLAATFSLMVSMNMYARVDEAV
jgi:hypothetical protein